MIAIIDYGAGNLFSVKNALDYLGCDSVVTGSAQKIESADGLILPGVGAFPDAMKKLDGAGLVETIRRQAERKPLLGICLGMQLLFEEGEEFGRCPGLGLIPGRVRLIRSGGLKLPQMGWNDLHILHPTPLSADLKDGDYLYFVHSYLADTQDQYICAYTEYGERIPALVYRDRIYGAQFHPEKSARIGLSILRRFVELVDHDASCPRKTL